MRTHFKAKHGGVAYYCDECEYRTTNKDHIKQHNEADHEGLKYYCDQCEFVTKF